MLIVVDDSARFWIEVKTAWNAWYSVSKHRVVAKRKVLFDSYLLGPHAGGLERKHSVSQDFEKLAELRAPDADRVSLLLVAFDSKVDPINPDIEKLERTLDLDNSFLQAEAPKSWPNRNCEQAVISCRFWWREVPR